ncbi:RsfS/YbeB/iojap family protein [Kocuria palustris]|nr:RsfS/YbeB/iojap family protein [Kocuria palustris]
MVSRRCIGDDTKNKAASLTPDVNKSSPANDEGLPWYLRDNSALEPKAAKPIELPPIPEDAAEVVPEFLNLMAHDYGMTDLVLFDLKELDSEHAMHPSNQSELEYVVIGSGKLEKHIYKAAHELRSYIKHTHDEIPNIEGMVSSAISPKQRRRMLRRARKGPLATDNDYGKLANLWVVATIKSLEIHMLTPQRREELLLEELYCTEEDKHKYVPDFAKDTKAPSDDIFFGIRRYHTVTKFATTRFAQIRNMSTESHPQVNSNLQTTFDRIAATSKSDASLTQFEHLVEEFDNTFNNISPLSADFNLKFRAYRDVHLVRPTLIPYQSVVDVLYQKHSRLGCTENPERDLIRLMRFAIDANPATEGREFGEYLLSETSTFISRLFRFSEPNLVLTNSMMVWLLVRMCYQVVSYDPVVSSTIDALIEQANDGPEGVKQILAKKMYTLGVPVATNRLRDIIELITYQLREAGKVMSPELRETILFIYGNGNDWRKFWSWWQNQCHFLSVDSEPQRKWIRLVSYLALRNVDSVQLTFMHELWNDGTRELMKVECQGKLLEQEKAVVVAAIELMAENLGGFENIVAEAKEL